MKISKEIRAVEQLGRRYEPEDNAMIVMFLKTLTGDQPSFKLPQLPPSSDRTPPADPVQGGAVRTRSAAPICACEPTW